MEINRTISYSSAKTILYIFAIFVMIMLYASLNYLKLPYNELLEGKIVSTDPVMEEMHLQFKEHKLDYKSIQSMKYILKWTLPKHMMFELLSEGQRDFTDRKCKYQNCYVTENRALLEDYTKFDAITFHGPEVLRMSSSRLPKQRSTHQKYVFGCMESSENYPVCSSRLNNFFNWTWTYRLEPYAKWGYLTVRDIDNNIIGPKDVMHWIKFSEMKQVSEEFKNKLKTKKKAAAWFVSNCNSRSHREKVVEKLHRELKKYQLSVDTYGGCGTFKCSRNNEPACDKVVEEDYYFYLAFENSFAEDYVTEKLLRPLKYNSVPIVYGAANYTRFMPDGIYLNARELGVEKLASEMNAIISDPDRYADFFRWKNHYVFHDSADYPDSDFYCGFCAMLNDEDYVKSTSIVSDFQKWWDPPGRC